MQKIAIGLSALLLVAAALHPTAAQDARTAPTPQYPAPCVEYVADYMGCVNYGELTEAQARTERPSAVRRAADGNGVHCPEPKRTARQRGARLASHGAHASISIAQRNPIEGADRHDRYWSSQALGRHPDNRHQPSKERRDEGLPAHVQIDASPARINASSR